MIPLRCEQPIIAAVFLLILCLCVVIRMCWHKAPTYLYSMAHVCLTQNVMCMNVSAIFFFISRLFLLITLALLIGRFQYADVHKQVSIDGHDMVLVLDVSGSMQYQDFEDDQRSRLEIAKSEANRFIEKRENDAIGLVIFGNDALSRCPLTLDKQLLKKFVDELHTGIIDPQGTVLARGIIAAANRLKHASAKSKIMIVLTDGEPSENDLAINDAIAIAKQLGIKVYTIGIGNEELRYIMHPFYGRVPLPSVNKDLLTRIAKETGGHYFFARNATDMRRIYDEIDKLETTPHQAPIFTYWHDLYLPIVLCILIVLVLECLCATYIWRKL